jgi:integrase
MAAIQEIHKKDGAISYKVHIRIKGATPKTKTFPTLESAQKYEREEEGRLRALLAAKKKSTAEDFYKSKLADVMLAYQQTLPKSDSDYYTINSAIRLFDSKSGPRIDELRPSFFTAYVAKALKTKSHRGEPYSPATIATFFTVMARAYKWHAVPFDIETKTHPFSNAYLPRGWMVERERRLEPEEEMALRLYFRSAKHRYQWLSLFNLALETAARCQELVLSTWDEFDLQRGVWTIPKAHTKAKKTRSVPLSDRAIQAVNLLAKIYKPAKGKRLFLCFSCPQRVSAAFTDIVKSCKIEDLHLHDLRHEAISRMVLTRRNMSVYEIMKIVGHSSIDMLNRYTNLRADELVDRFRNITRN